MNTNEHESSREYSKLILKDRIYQLVERAVKVLTAPGNLREKTYENVRIRVH